MRVLHIVERIDERYGGSARACIHMAEATARLGHDVTVLTTNVDGEAALDASVGEFPGLGGARIVSCPIQRPAYRGVSIPLARAARMLVRASDVVNLHGLYNFPVVVGAAECARSRTPYVLRPHGTLDPFLVRHHRWRRRLGGAVYVNRMIRGACAIHYTSEDEMELARPEVFGRPGFVVPLGVDLDEVRGVGVEGTMRDRFPAIRSDKVLLFLGRVTLKKGLDLLMSAMGRLCECRDDTCLVIAGPEDVGFGEKVRRWASDAGVSDKVHWVGMVSGDDKKALLADSDLFVLSSYSENFGLAVVEAMAAGLPVVVSDKVNIWRDVAEAGAGVVVRCDAAELADALERVLDGDQYASRLGQSGRHLAETRFTWDATAHGLIAAYARVMDGGF